MALLEELFLGTLRMSAGAALCVAAVLLIRLLLRKAPRVFSYALWAVVLFRLLCPFVPKTPWSPMPSAEIVPVPDEKYSYVQVSTGISAVDGPVNDYLYRHPLPQREANVGRYPTGEPMVTFPADGEAPLTWVSVGSLVWLAGLLAMLLWGAVSTLRLRWRLREAVKQEGERDIWLADHIPTAFLWGGLFPRIYLPSDLPESVRDYVVRHERVHAGRGDHLIRLAAWVALVIHWFDPLVWLAFWLAGRDMEMSCDETVLRQYSRDVRAGYSEALLRQYTRPLSPMGPLAFGDSDPQSRIKNVLNYKKPAFWVVVIALVAVVAAGLLLFTGRSFPRAEIQPNGERFFNAVVLEDRGGSLLAEVSDGFNSGLSAGARVTVTKSVLSPGNYPGGVKEGDAVRVVFNGLVMETDPAQLGTVFAVYLLDENGEAAPNRGP